MPAVTVYLLNMLSLRIAQAALGKNLVIACLSKSRRESGDVWCPFPCLQSQGCHLIPFSYLSSLVFLPSVALCVSSTHAFGKREAPHMSWRKATRMPNVETRLSDAWEGTVIPFGYVGGWCHLQSRCKGLQRWPVEKRNWEESSTSSVTLTP